MNSTTIRCLRTRSTSGSQSSKLVNSRQARAVSFHELARHVRPKKRTSPINKNHWPKGGSRLRRLPPRYGVFHWPDFSRAELTNMGCQWSLVGRLDLLPMAVLLMIGGKLPAQRAKSAHFVGHLPSRSYFNTPHRGNMPLPIGRDRNQYVCSCQTP